MFVLIRILALFGYNVNNYKTIRGLITKAYIYLILKKLLGYKILHKTIE